MAAHTASSSRTTSQLNIQPPESMSPISNRTWLHAKAKDLGSVAALIDPDHSGAIVTGKPKAEAIKQFRHEFTKTPLLFDTAAYEKLTATPDQPFLNDDLALISSLEHQLDEQLTNGAPIAVTPTLFISTGDKEALHAVLSKTSALNRDDILCLLPLDAKWFNEDNFSTLIDTLAAYPIPLAVALGHPSDPLSTRYARRGLRQLVDAIPRLGLFRTDLAAFEVMSRGGLTSSIGVRASLRHFAIPGSNGFVSNDDKSHNILVPPLLQWIKGQKIANDLVGEPDLLCDCPTCGGDSLKRFIGQDLDTKCIAEQHAIACWMSMAAELARIKSPVQRINWWQQRCADAATTVELWRTQYGLTAEPSDSIRYWAQKN